MCQACSPVFPLFLHCPRLLAPQNSLLEPPNAQRCNKNNHPATCGIYNSKLAFLFLGGHWDPWSLGGVGLERCYHCDLIVFQGKVGDPGPTGLKGEKVRPG